MKRVAIVSAVRTPLGKLGGALKDVAPEELTKIVIEEARNRARIESKEIDEVIIGQTKQTTDAPNIARLALLKAEWDELIPAYAVHRQCASGMQAILNGMQQIQCDYSEVVMVGGVESMSTAPFYVRNTRFGTGSGNQILLDPNTESQPNSQPQEIYGTFSMIKTADNVAEKYNVTREEQDEYALLSQQRAVAAIDNGYFKEEIVPVRIPRRKQEDLVFDTDEFPRRDTSIEKLAKLRPINEGGTVTAGNASGRNDGACAILLMSEEKAKALDCKPLAYVTAATAVGLDPRYMGMGPYYASKKLFEKYNKKLTDFDLFEINEAFASQTVASAKELGIDMDKLNVNGGGIALGHPLGCSGTRIITTMMYEMKRRGVREGLASICVAGGLGMAMAIENAE